MKEGISMAYELDEIDIEILNLSNTGRKYLEYYDKFKSKPIILSVGMPDIIEMYGGVIGVYDECIRLNKTWEQMIGEGWDEIEL